MPAALLPIYTLWWREITRFRRQRSRWSSALIQPLVFWLLLGGGLNPSFRPQGAAAGLSYLEYFYPGILALVLLFTAIFATIAVVEDRREGFLQGVLVAPVTRTGIVLGQACGATTLAVLQGALFLLLAPVIGIPLHLTSVLTTLVVLCCVAFSLTNLGLILAWRMRSTQGFHAIMNVLLLPLWLLSGAFFPTAGVPFWLAWIMWINPLTYGVAVLRRSLYADAVMVGAVPTWLPALAITVLFDIVTLLLAVRTAQRTTL